MASTVSPRLKSVACGVQGSGEKENESEKDGKEMSGLFQNNSSKHVCWEYSTVMNSEKR